MLHSCLISRHSRSSCLKWIQNCRKNSSLSSLYHPKVRALKFDLDPEVALRRMAPFASMQMMGHRMIKSVLASMFNFFDVYQAAVPDRFIPVYFPGWIIDTEMDAKVTDSDGNSNNVYCISSDSYLPGSSYQFLSILSYNYDEISPSSTLPVTEDLIRIRDRVLDVNCLPYNISPLLFDKLDLRANPFKGYSMRINQNPKSHILAAYPVLFPMYLAQYSRELKRGLPVDENNRVVNVWIEAHNSRGRMHSPVNSFQNVEGYPMKTIDWLNNSVKLLGEAQYGRSDVAPILTFGGKLSYWFNIDHFSSYSSGKNIVEVVEADTGLKKIVKEVEAHLHSPDMIESMADLSDHQVDMDDERIRPYTQEEVDATRNWMNQGTKLQELSLLHDQTSRAAEDARMRGLMLQLNSDLPRMIEECKRQREEDLPEWWRRYLLTRKSTKKKS